MTKENNFKGRLFGKRLIAFLIDVILVSFAASVVCLPFLDYDSIDNLTNNYYELESDYISGEVDVKTYINHSSSILYRASRAQGLLSLVSIFFNILYFVVYQFYNKGQTLGKKILKIQVVSNSGDDLTINHYIYRYFVFNSILIDMIVLAFVILAKQDMWFHTTLILGIVNYITLFVCGIMAFFHKEGRGLHDLVSNTKVIQYRK